MSQFTQGESHNFCVDGLEEEGAKFCFGHGCGDHFQYGTVDKDGAINADWESVLEEQAKEKIGRPHGFVCWVRPNRRHRSGR